VPRIFVLLFLLCCGSSHIGASFAAVRLSSGTVSHDLAAEVFLLEDASGRLSFADIQKRAAEFKPAPVTVGDALNFGYSSSVWWLRFDLETEPAAPLDWLLELAFPSLDHVEYFGPGGERVVTGDRLPFSARPIAHRNFVFPVHLNGSGVSTVWLRVTSEGSLTLPLRMWRTDAFWQQSQNIYALHWIYFGMLLALALYNLLLWFSLRDHTYITYVTFAASMAVGQLSFNGLGNEYLWPDSPLWGSVAFAGGFAATGLFGALFTRGFLETRDNAPRLDKVVLGLAAMFAISMLVTGFAPYRIGAIMTTLTGVTFSLVAVFAGLYCWRRGAPGAPIFLLAWTLLLIGVAVASLRHMNFLPTNFYTLNAMQIGSALEMLLLSFALADRINGLRFEKEAARSEALATKQQLAQTLQRSEATLERRVAERTEELEMANARLRDNERQLQALALADPLTGLANRLLLSARLQQSMQLARRSQGKIAVLFADLDHFKLINDGYGRAIGEEVLRCAADRLRTTVRQVDTVARLEDDEFAIVLTGLVSSADAENMATKIIATIGEPMRVLGMPLEINASIGIVVFSGGDLSSAELLRRAQQAMQAAKAAGRGCYIVADSS
jgi:diguanylate cyclase (GGDEF)-like protein